MKKINKCRQLAVALLALLACSGAAAQTHYTSAVMKHMILQTPEGHPRPIQNWNNQYSVCAIGSNTSVGLALIDHSAFFAASTGYAPVCTEKYVWPFSYLNDTNVTVNDIYIDGNMAFFCGSYRSPSYTRAMAGYVSLTNLAAGSATLYYGEIASIESLKRLVAYRSGSSYKVYAIGETVLYSESPTYTRESIVEIPDIMSSSVLCNIAPLPVTSFSNKEYLYDVLLTENYVVFVGHNYNMSLFPPGSDMVHYRMMDRDDDLSSSTIHNVHFLAAPAEANSRVAATTLEENDIAISYVHIDSPTSPNYGRLRVVNVANDANIVSQEMLRPDKEDPIMMDYMPDYEIVESLHPYHNPYDFIGWEPYNTATYTATMLTPPAGHDYRYVRNMAGRRFIATSGPYVYMQNPLTNVPASDPTCPLYKTVQVNPISNATIYVIPSPLSTFSVPVNISFMTNSSPTITLDKICHSEQ